MRLRAALAAVAATALLGSLVSVAPWLAVTAPVGARTLVVEGWVPADRLPEVLRLARARRVEQVFVTGGGRPLAHYLRAGDTLVVGHAPMPGIWRLELAGLPGQGWQIRTEAGILREGVAGDATEVVDVDLRSGSRTLRLAVLGGTVGDSTALLFVRDLRQAGRSMAETGHEAAIHHASGARTSCPLTWAEDRVRLLVRLGLPPGAVHAVQGPLDLSGRTAAAAQAMATAARRKGLGTYDVLTLGVHARRTRNAHRRAGGGALRVGVIALPDPRVPPHTWWLRPAAWPVVAKELAGLLRDGFTGTFGT